MALFSRRIGIDLGTTYTLVYLPGRGIVLNEPSVVALSMSDKKVLAVGDEAKEMIGRTPDSIIALRPLKDGVIADYRTTEAMLRYFINKSLGGVRFIRPEVMIAVPGGVTPPSAERLSMPPSRPVLVKHLLSKSQLLPPSAQIFPLVPRRAT